MGHPGQRDTSIAINKIGATFCPMLSHVRLLSGQRVPVNAITGTLLGPCKLLQLFRCPACPTCRSEFWRGEAFLRRIEFQKVIRHGVKTWPLPFTVPRDRAFVHVSTFFGGEKKAEFLDFARDVLGVMPAAEFRKSLGHEHVQASAFRYPLGIAGKLAVDDDSAVVRRPKTMLITLDEGSHGHYCPYVVRHADAFGKPCPHHLRNGGFDFLLGEGQDTEVDGLLARRLDQGKPPQRAPLLGLQARYGKARFGFRERLLNVRSEGMEIMKVLDQGLDERRHGSAVMLAAGAF